MTGAWKVSAVVDLTEELDVMAVELFDAVYRDDQTADQGELRQLFMNAQADSNDDFEVRLFICTHNARLIGFGAWERTGSASYLLSFGMVHPDCHHRGIGEALVRARVSDIDERADGRSIIHVDTLRPRLFAELGFRIGTTLADGKIRMVRNRRIAS